MEPTTTAQPTARPVAPWYARARLNGGTYADWFETLEAAHRWQTALFTAYGWDWDRGDRAEVTWDAAHQGTKALSATMWQGLL